MTNGKYSFRLVTTSRESALYDVCDRETNEHFNLHLWVIVGGTPALALHNYACSKRFSKLHWDTCAASWDGPRLHRFPSGEVDGYLIWALPEYRTHMEVMKIEAKIARVEVETNISRYDWPERDVEDEPRMVPCLRHDDEIVCLASSFANALKGAPGNNKGTVQIDNRIIVGVTQFRRLMQELAKGIYIEDCRLDITMHDDRMEISTTLDGALRKRMCIKHGAWDKYYGYNGFDCYIEFTILKEGLIAKEND